LLLSISTTGTKQTNKAGVHLFEDSWTGMMVITFQNTEQYFYGMKLNQGTVGEKKTTQK